VRCEGWELHGVDCKRVDESFALSEGCWQVDVGVLETWGDGYEEHEVFMRFVVVVRLPRLRIAAPRC
jgi:hypothetical protein